MIRKYSPKLAIVVLLFATFDVHVALAASPTLNKIKEVGKIS